MDMLHQPRTQHIKKYMKQFLKQWESKVTTLVDNYIKANFLKFLGKEPQKNGFNVIQWQMDAEQQS